MWLTVWTTEGENVSFFLAADDHLCACAVTFSQGQLEVCSFAWKPAAPVKSRVAGKVDRSDSQGQDDPTVQSPWCTVGPRTGEMRPIPPRSVSEHRVVFAWKKLLGMFRMISHSHVHVLRWSVSCDGEGSVSTGLGEKVLLLPGNLTARPLCLWWDCRVPVRKLVVVVTTSGWQLAARPGQFWWITVRNVAAAERFKLLVFLLIQSRAQA